MNVIAPILGAPQTPQRHEALLEEPQREAVLNLLNQPGWEYGWKSNVKLDPFGFLHKHFAGPRQSAAPPYDCDAELQINSPVIHEAWLAVQRRVFDRHRLVRCYANGMAYGMDGFVHTDATTPGNYTVVYYPHARWSANWGGETIFYNEKLNRVFACFHPLPNSAVVFDGRIPHRANGVTRMYTGMRITLMFKVEALDGLPAAN